MKIYLSPDTRSDKPIKEFMTPNPFTVKLSDSVKKVIDTMGFSKIGSAIVVNEENYPVNILTKSDILKLMILNYTDINVEEALKILKIETRELITVKDETPILDCMKLFFSRRIKHLPVISKSNKLVGIISVSDVIQKASILFFTDNLTELGNRHYLDSIKLKIVRYKEKAPIGILMIDVDNFKKLNDTYGHFFGDIVLKEIANVLVKNTRVVDEVIRYGGEEFLIILFKASEKVINRVAERIRKNVESLRFEDYPELKVTVSIGATLCTSSVRFETCIETADKALYEAKNAGKNRTVFFPCLRFKSFPVSVSSLTEDEKSFL